MVQVSHYATPSLRPENAFNFKGLFSEKSRFRVAHATLRVDPPERGPAGRPQKGRLMARFGKPDATGRSSGILTGQAGRFTKPPKGEPWVWLTRGLLESDAWCAMSINALRLISFLLIEHMNHAGRENGRLLATYDQLQIYGLTRSEILSAIQEVEFLGLARVEYGARGRATRFTLTFLPDHDDNRPTDDWKRLTAGQINAWCQKRTAARARRRKQKSMSKSRTKLGRKVELNAVHRAKPE